ncbi:MAG TPA: efflux RND transporter periplasmic adaptor subunit [Casimicrobiaceae bacterium]|nr:efflux RND transporter periplasmic adaptor subunit [Casimicrobiaceae bacterium]
MKSLQRYFAATALAGLALLSSGCGKSGYTSGAASPASAPQATGEKKPASAEPDHAAGKDEHGAAGAIKLTEAEIAAAGVKTAKAVEEAVRAGITVTATIQPNQDRVAHVAPRVPGRLLEVPARLGDTVRAGQILATVDSVEVGEASAAYHQASSQLVVAKSEFERAETLYGEQVVAQKEFLRSRGEYERARAAQAAALDKLRLMGVKPSAATTSTLPVTAPFAGTVIEKHAVIGELAQPDKHLFTVADLSTVWIEANLYEKDLARIRPGSEAVVTVSAYPEERFKGRLAYVSATVERESRTVKARIEVPNGDRRLKPEMFATAVVQTQERSRAIAVPTEAVVLVDNRSTVFVKDGDGFEPRAVDVGDVVNDRQIVKAGLEPGDDVVVSGAYALKSRLLKSKIGEGH